MLHDHHARPFAAALIAVALYALMDALMKGAALAMGAYSALLLRGLFGLGLTVPLWLAGGPRRPPAAALRLHVTRGVLSTGMAFTFFWGLTRMPLAEGIGLSFIAPLIALYLAAVLLGERVDPRALAASLLGLAGVAVIAAGQLGTDDGHGKTWLGMAAVLLSAVLYAWNLVLQRQQALLARPLEVATFQNAVVSLVLLCLAPWFLQWPTQATAWGAVAAAALLAMFASMLFAWAYARAEAQALVPLEYSAFLWAILFGWLFFAEEVRPATLAGVVLIVTACLAAAPRKRPEATAA